jgi:hypothetical protein
VGAAIGVATGASDRLLKKELNPDDGGVTLVGAITDVTTGAVMTVGTVNKLDA